MKKLILLLLFIPLVSLGQTEHLNFKIENSAVIWQKIYDKDLDVESQPIKLQAIGLPKMTTTFWLSDISGADMKVEKKDGRTRITLTKIFSISRNTINLGNVIQNPKPTYIEEGYLKKGEFKRLFIKKDGALVEEIILREIKALLPGNDDW